MTRKSKQATALIPLSEPFIGREEENAARECLLSGFVSSSGPLVGEFEKQFATAVGVRYAVATASGTAAIHVALKTLNIARGDSVFIPDLTFVASMNPVLYCGARPVLLDVETESWCLDPVILERRCAAMANNGRKPFAVIPVHLYGSNCNMDAIMSVAHKYDLRVIEDATEALGTKLNGRQVGTFGDIGCFSFNGNKMITTGSGGMIVTDNETLATRARYLVNQARDSGANYIHSEAGFNYRMNSISAAVGMAQLKKLDGFLGKKREIAARYSNAFKNIDGIQLHPEARGVNSSFWLYSVVFETMTERDLMIQGLQDDGIQSRGFFHPLHAQPYIRSRVWTQSPNGTSLSSNGISDRLSACGLNLPSSCGMKPADQARVINSFLGRLKRSFRQCTRASRKETLMQKTA